MDKLCLTCNSKFTGRSDKKFCNDACKNEYHNQVNSVKKPFEKLQLSAARKNHGILSKLETLGKEKIALEELELYGFDFEGFTGVRILDKGKFLLSCFDFRLQPEGKLYKINKCADWFAA